MLQSLGVVRIVSRIPSGSLRGRCAGIAGMADTPGAASQPADSVPERSDFTTFRLAASHLHPRPWWAAGSDAPAGEMRVEEDSMGSVLVPAQRSVHVANWAPCNSYRLTLLTACHLEPIAATGARRHNAPW